MEVIDNRIVVFRDALNNTEQKRIKRTFDRISKDDFCYVADKMTYDQYEPDSEYNIKPIENKYHKLLRQVKTLPKKCKKFSIDKTSRLLLGYKYKQNIPRKYRRNSLIGYHFDVWSNYNLTISIGHTVRFYFKDSKNTDRAIDIHSGDMVLFDGNSVEHAVVTLQDDKDDKCPEWYDDKSTYRYNLQFRNKIPLEEKKSIGKRLRGRKRMEKE